MSTTREVWRSGAKGGQGGGGDTREALTGLEDAMRRLAIRHYGFQGVLRGREREEFMQENDPRFFDPFKRFYREQERRERQRQRREREGSEEVALQLVPRANAPVVGQQGVQAGAAPGVGGAGADGDDEPPPPNEAWQYAQRYDLRPYEAALEARRVELGRTTRRPRGSTDPLRLIQGKMSRELSLGVLHAARVYLVQEQGHLTWKGLRFLENVLKKEIVDPDTHLEEDLHRYPNTALPPDPADAVFEPLREHCEDPLAWLTAYEAMARVVFTRGERELFTLLVSEYVARFSESLVQRAVDLRGKLTTKQKRYVTSTGRVVWVEADEDASDSDPWDDEGGFEDDDDERRSLASVGDSDDSDSDGEGGVGGFAQGGDAATTVFDRVEAVNLRRMLRMELENYMHSAPDDYSPWYRAEAERLREARLQHVERVWRHARKQLERQLAGGAKARDPVLQAFVTMDEPDEGVGSDERHALLWYMFEAAEQEDIAESNARFDRILFPPKPASASREAVRRAQRELGVIGDDDDEIDASVGLADASIEEQVAVWLAEELESYYHRAADDYSPRYRAKVEKLRRRWVQDHVDEFAARAESPLSEAEIGAKAREFEAAWGRMTGAGGSVVLFPPKPAENSAAATLAHELREGQARLNAALVDKRAARARQRAQMQAQLRREIRGHVSRLVNEGKSMEEVVAAVEALWKERRFAPRVEAEARRAMVRQAAEALDREFKRKELRAEQRRMRRLREERRGLYSGLRLQHGLTAHRRPDVGGARGAVTWEQLLPRARKVATGALAAQRPTQAATLARSRNLEAQIQELQAKLQATERPPARDATEESFREVMRAYTPRKRRLSEKVYSLMRDELDLRNMQAMKAHIDGFVVPAAWENAVAGAAAAGRGPRESPRAVQMCISVRDPPLLDVRETRETRETLGGGVGARGKRAVPGGGGDGEAYWRRVFDDEGPVPAFISDVGAGPSRAGGGV